MSDVTWWKRGQSSGGKRDEPVGGSSVPGDTNASDIVGRTGEEMPEVAHDEGEFDNLPIQPDRSDDERTLPAGSDELKR